MNEEKGIIIKVRLYANSVKNPLEIRNTLFYQNQSTNMLKVYAQMMRIMQWHSMRI
jgi:hypothetical protein